MGGSDRINERVTKLDMKIDHIQIDNVVNNNMPVFFCPTKELWRGDGP